MPEAGGVGSIERSKPSKTAEIDNALNAFGFELEAITPNLVSGRLKVTSICCQPFNVLHGGVSALISEALASIGAHLASGYRRVAGIQLSINHVRAARLGEQILAEATPLQVGRSIQVWQVQLWKANSETAEKEAIISSARVTFLSNMPVPEHAADAAAKLRKHAKL